jgi:hypothetical protein
VLRGLRVLALALCGIAEAAAQPRIELTLAPAWDGWSRPGRVTEVDVRLQADAVARGTLQIVSGRETVRAPLELQAGRTLRLHVPVATTDRLDVSLRLDETSPTLRTIRIAQSESPLLGLGMASGDGARLDGFHSIALGPDDLPRNAAAYSSVDALVLDTPTLAALDQRQLGALLAYTAACGHLALVSPDPGARRVLEGAAGCGGAMLIGAASLAEAAARLQASLAEPPAQPPVSMAGLGDLVQPDLSLWHRVLMILVVYLGAAALAVTFSASARVFLFVSLLATACAWGAMRLAEPVSHLVVWAESGPSARTAQYQAWHRFTGGMGGSVRVPLLAQLGAARSCNRNRAARFEFDVNRGRLVAAEFDTRLFQPLALCYSGNFPVMRDVSVAARPGDALDIRNAGSLAWPAGTLAANGLVYAVPALGPGETATLSAAAGQPPPDAAARAALSRTPYDGYAALWPLELGSVADAPIDSAAWLLVTIPPPP